MNLPLPHPLQLLGLGVLLGFFGWVIEAGIRFQVICEILFFGLVSFMNFASFSCHALILLFYFVLLGMLY